MEEPLEQRLASVRASDPVLARACEGEGLRIAFQPIFRLRDASIYGYEALMRPSAPFASPLELLERANAAGLGLVLELAAIGAAMRAFVRLDLCGRLFLNLSASAMQASARGQNRVIECAIAEGLAPARVVTELTEREPASDLNRIVETMREMRDCGLGVALDDYGQGYSGMRLWLELRPDVVKIDQYFVSDLHANSAKFEALRSLSRLARSLDTELVAEGVETASELAVLRDLGVPLAQGYFLGRPATEPVREIDPAARATLGALQITVFPERLHVHAPHETVGRLLKPVAGVRAATTNNEIARRFDEDPLVHALAVVDGQDRPLGLLNRQTFLDRLNKPFHRELYGKRECSAFMNAQALVVEADAPVESLMQVISGADPRYLSEGFVIVRNGRYLGLGTGEGLVRAISALRIEAARHANPLTYLPGNIPLSEHITRLLDRQVPFVAAYADLDCFKPFNDEYGYWRGDEMIKLAAATILGHLDPSLDFVGHVGGDDFVVLFQSRDWLPRCEAMVRQFADEAPRLYNAQDRERGGIAAEDRHGNHSFFRLTTLSVGVVEVAPGGLRSPEAVASQAAAAKRRAKRTGNCVVAEVADAAPERAIAQSLPVP